MLNDVYQHRFGVNYTPLKNWYYCWNEWDVDAIQRDLEVMAGLGVDHLRLQLIWPYFQPNPTYVSEAHLGRLRQFMRIAEPQGLDVLPSLLTGFLSGYFFLPPNVAASDVFHSKQVFESIAIYFRRVLDTLADCPNLMGIDLGNEINCLDHTLSPDEGDAWARRLLREIGDAAAGIDVVNGIDHTPVLGGTTFGMKHLANDYPYITLHTWPYFTGCLEHGGLDDPPSIHLAAFTAQFARMYAVETERPVWIQEFGCCDLWGSPEQQEVYLRKTVASAVEHGVTHFTFWCSHRRSGEASPRCDPDTIIAVPDEFVPRFRKGHPPATWVEQQASSSLWDVYDTYLELVAKGRRPTLRLKSRLGDDAGLNVVEGMIP
jgi:hypothetical protein